MNKKPPVLKTIAWVYGAVAAFATAYIVGGILLDKQGREDTKKYRR